MYHRLAQLSGWISRHLDDFEKIAKIVSLVFIPIVLAIGANSIQKQLQDNRLSREFFQMALDVLKEEKRDGDNFAMRRYAVSILDQFSPVYMGSEIRDGLVSGKVLSESKEKSIGLEKLFQQRKTLVDYSVALIQVLATSKDPKLRASAAYRLAGAYEAKRRWLSQAYSSGHSPISIRYNQRVRHYPAVPDIPSALLKRLSVEWNAVVRLSVLDSLLDVGIRQFDKQDSNTLKEFLDDDDIRIRFSAATLGIRHSEGSWDTGIDLVKQEHSSLCHLLEAGPSDMVKRSTLLLLEVPGEVKNFVESLVKALRREDLPMDVKIEIARVIEAENETAVSPTVLRFLERIIDSEEIRELSDRNLLKATLFIFRVLPKDKLAEFRKKFLWFDRLAVSIAADA